MRAAFVLTAFALPAAPTLSAQPVAAIPEKTVGTEPHFWREPNGVAAEEHGEYGRAAADLLFEQLLETGYFRIVERRALEGVKSEQDLVGSDRAAANQSVAQQAKLHGAKYMVTGAITKFGRSQDKKAGFGGIAAAIVGQKMGGAFSGVSSGKTTYQIEITARIVDTETGEVAAAMTSDGSAVGNKSRTIVGGGMLASILFT